MKTKTRQTNIELLRIIAMLLVLVVHADFYSLGDATLANSHYSMTELSLKIFFESLSIGCVDIFILISGYFGINAKASGFAKFIFQCLFVFLLVYFGCVIFGLQSLAPKGIADCLCLFRQSNWFIQAYVLLYILSPVLNAFCQNTDRTTFRNVLVGFFVFQTIYGCTGSADFFVGGFSTISFVGLYLLARYVRIYPSIITSKSPLFDFCIFGGVVVLMTLMGICPSVTGFTVPYLSSYNYINPLIIYIISILTIRIYQTGYWHYPYYKLYRCFILYSLPFPCKSPFSWTCI